MDVLHATDIHPDASWIYQQVRSHLPHISLGTVYRNLTWLAAEGMVREIRMRDRASHWDGRAHDHSHIVCISCGEIVDVDLGSWPNEWCARAVASTGFRLTGQRVELEGICPACQAQETRITPNSA